MDSIGLCAIFFKRSFIHFHASCFSGEGCGASSLGRTQNTSQSLAISHNPTSYRLHTKTGPGKVKDAITPPDPWMTSGLLSMGVASRTCFTKLSWDILDTCLNQHSWDLSIRKSGWTWTAWRISQLCTFSPSVTLRTLHNNPISTACTWDLFFWS